jgi:hypothetical protein
MEPEGSLPCSQEPATGLSQMNTVHTISSYFSKIYFNIILSPKPMSSQWSLSFWLSHQNPICFLRLPHTCYMPCPSHPAWLDHSNYIWRRVRIMELIIRRFSTTSYYFTLLWSKYSRQHSDLKYFHLWDLKVCDDGILIPLLVFWTLSIV